MFYFPQALQKIETSRSFQDIQEVLQAEYRLTINEKICPKFPFVFAGYFQKGKLYARAKCRFCKSFMNWKQKEQGGPLHLTRYSLNHDHHQKKRGNTAKLKIMNYLQSIKISLPPKLHSHIAEVFNISKAYANKLINQWEGKQMKSLKKIENTLRQKEISFNYWPMASKTPQVTVIITPDMRRMYCQYGFSIKLDFSFKVIKNTVSEKHGPQKQQHLGLISGINSYNRIIIFGIVIVSEETGQNIRKSLEYFFNFMGEECECIITGQGHGMEEAISSMNEDFFKEKVTHLLDQYLVVGNLNLWKKQEDLKKYKMVSTILKSATVSEFHMNCSQLQKELQQNERDQLQKFKKLASRCCMAMIETSDFIASIITNSSSFLNKVIKRKIKLSLSYLQAIPKIMEICQSINKKAVKQPYLCKFELQKVCDIQDIRTVRKVLPKKIFEIILGNLFSSKDVNIIEEQQNQIVVSEFGEKVTLVRAGEDQIWKCQCLYQNRSGLPCPHLMKIIKRIDPYIHQFWNINKALVNGKKSQITRKRRRP